MIPPPMIKTSARTSPEEFPGTPRVASLVLTLLFYQRASGGRAFTRALQRFDEFVGEDARFLCQIAGAHPIVGVDGFVGLLKEVADFFNQVVLRRIEFFAFRGLQILFGVSDVRVGALLGGGLRLRRHFG